MRQSLRRLQSGWRHALLVGMALTILAWGTSAEAQSCGQVLTGTTTLTADLLNCPGDGLVIGDHDIVLDLNGYTVDGVGLGVGIRNDGFDRVTIKNGTVKEFDYGIQLNPGTRDNIVELLTVTLNEFAGIQLSGAAYNRLHNNTISEQPQAGVAVLNGSIGNVVEYNTIDRSQGRSLVLENSGSNTIQGNTVSNGGDEGVVFTVSSNNSFVNNTLSNIGDTGLLLEAGSNWNNILYNTFTRTGDSGASVIDSNSNLFQFNQALEKVGDAGFKFTRAHGNQILGNTARAASDCGIFLEFSNNNRVWGNDVQLNSCGIDLAHSDGNRVEWNNASNTTSIGINLEDSSANVVVANVASSNKAQGIYVVGEAEVAGGNLIDGNIAESNLGGGIVVANGAVCCDDGAGSAGHTIRNNVANKNASWGIYAAPTNTDGGDNQASGNAEPAQCFGVVCGP